MYKPSSAKGNGGIAVSRRSPACGIVILIAAFDDVGMAGMKTNLHMLTCVAKLNNEIASNIFETEVSILTISNPSLLSSLTTI